LWKKEVVEEVTQLPPTTNISEACSIIGTAVIITETIHTPMTPAQKVKDSNRRLKTTPMNVWTAMASINKPLARSPRFVNQAWAIQAEEGAYIWFSWIHLKLIRNPNASWKSAMRRQ
jgi:hypothetical protein